jgi:hypothetical protein
MDLGLAARYRLQGADRQPLSRFLHASQRGAKNGSHRTRWMCQSQAGFLPAYLAGLSSILRDFSWLRRFHHRQHAAVDFRNQHRHADHAPTLGPIAFLLFLRPHRRPVFLGHHAHGTHGNFYAVVLFQLRRCPGKGILGTKIGHGSL